MPTAAWARYGRAALTPLASLLVLVLVWQIAALIAASPRILPSPATVLGTMAAETASGNLPFHLGMTLYRVAVSFVLAMCIGTAIGLVMGRARRVNVFADPWLVFLLNLPALVTIVLAYIWVGLTEVAAIGAVALNKIPNVVVTMREGARALDPSLNEMARVFEVPRGRTLRHVVLPQLFPYGVAAARTGLALIWKIVLVVELLGRSNGVGFQIGVFFQLFDVASILAYALAFIVVVQLIEWCLIQPLERRVTAWRR